MPKHHSVSPETKRLRRVEQGITDKRKFARVTQTIREFRKVAAHDTPEVYEEMLDEMEPVLRIKK